MSLPNMSDKSIMRPTVRTSFGGLNHNLNARDGEIYDMLNMSSREFPLLTPRPRRGLIRTLSNPNGAGAFEDDEWWSDFNGFYFNGELKGRVTNTQKQFAKMGQMIFIFPDKWYYDIDADVFAPMVYARAKVNLRFQNGTYAGVPANANTIYKLGAEWGFHPGDAVTITGCETHPENNKTAIIQEVDGDYLRFYENTFTLDSIIRYTVPQEGLPAGTYHFDEGGQFTLDADLTEGDTLTWNGTSIDAVIGGVSSTIEVTAGTEGEALVFSDIPIDYTESGPVTLAREVPDLDYVCVNENRLWGCKGDTIFASALGDPFNFGVLDGSSTGSWIVDATDSDGDFTGCVSFMGNPYFFKEDSIYKVYGDKPSNFQWTQTAYWGVKRGCDRSLAVAGDTLFYLSRVGVCAYTGGKPSVISAPLGVNMVWSKGVGGTDGLRYYVCLTEEDSNNSNVYVYDTRYGCWHRESSTAINCFYFCGGGLYMVRNFTGEVFRADGRDGTLEDPITWQVKFADSDNFYETTDTASQNKKGPLRILIRATLAENSTVEVKIKYDDGTDHLVGTITGTSSEKKKTYILPLILRRCDHYRLSLDGYGDAAIYSISVERYSGSQFQGSPGVTLPTQSY